MTPRPRVVLAADWGGHRVSVMKHIDAALNELNLAVPCGKWHGRASSVPPQSHSQQRRSGHTITRLAAERRSERALSESLS
jgi:hypothetical protein